MTEPEMTATTDRDEPPYLGVLGPALALLRTRSGKKQKDVAEATPMSRSQVSRYEKGKAVPNLGSLFLYLGAVGARLGDLDEAIETESRRRVLGLHSKLSGS